MCLLLYVYFGLESGNNEILRLANKGESVEHNYKAAKMMDERDIKILASYVLGLEMESEKTLEDTYEFAEKIADLKSTELTQAGFIVPFPGSSLYYKLTERLPEKYKNEDLFNPEGTRKDWIEHFCNFISNTEKAYDLIEETSRKMIKLSPIQTNYLGIEPD